MSHKIIHWKINHKEHELIEFFWNIMHIIMQHLHLSGFEILKMRWFLLMHPKSIRNNCVIKHFCEVFADVILTIQFWHEDNMRSDVITFFPSLPSGYFKHTKHKQFWGINHMKQMCIIYQIQLRKCMSNCS